LTALEKILSQYGDAWVWCAFDPVNKLLPVFVVGKRTMKNARELVRKLDEVTDDTIPFFTSDELRHYERALLETYGIVQEVPRQTGKRGRPPKPKLIPHPELQYAQVVKKRKKGRVVSVGTAIVFGDPKDVKKHLAASPTSKHINTSFVERNNLTMRQSSRRLARRGNGFSKEFCKLESQLYLASGYYHFVKTHLGLREKAIDGPRKWRPRTPALAAQLTDHIWSARELLAYRVP
jgi:IS1 family transposase